MNSDIVFIDSGVNPLHPHTGRISGGHGYVMNKADPPRKNSDFMDEIGHGTAIAGIIAKKAPFADLYAVKIFETELNASISVLAAALEWAVSKGFKMIHLSLGVTGKAAADQLKPLCRAAAQKKIIILASAKGPDDKTYPAFFPEVIGVYHNPVCGWDQMVCHPGTGVEFGAHGFPRPIPGLPKEQNYHGHSFAVAHITARAAGLVKEYPEKDVYWIRERLAVQSDYYNEKA